MCLDVARVLKAECRVVSFACFRFAIRERFSKIQDVLNDSMEFLPVSFKRRRRRGRH